MFYLSHMYTIITVSTGNDMELWLSDDIFDINKDFNK